MMTFLGFAMIATFLTLIMAKKMSPLGALILIPALFCVLVGKGAHLGDYVVDGIEQLAPTAAMLMFAIIFFGIMIDVGLFDPIVRAILRFCKADPLRVVVGTALLASVVSLDGDGSTTFMITVSALLPLYRKLKMRVLILTAVAATANGVMNTLPWGGPTSRAATALKLDAADVFVPMIPALACGLLFVFVLSWVLGMKERRRLGVLTLDEPAEEPDSVDAPASAEERVTAGKAGAVRTGAAAAAVPSPRSTAGGGATGTDTAGTDTADGTIGLDPQRPTLRPRLYWFNAALTLALLTLLILQVLPIPVLFLLGAAIALSVNFPDVQAQKERLAAHSGNVVNVSGMVFAAAVFTGVLTGTGMVDNMALSLVRAIPDGLGGYMGPITGLLSIPLTYFMSNDGFYFGIVPILAEAGAAHGVPPAEIARASLVGQPLHMSSPLVPAVYVLVGMAKVEFGDHTRYTVKWAALTSLVVLGTGFLFGIF